MGTLVMNVPSKLNALNIQVLRELKMALQELHRSPLRGLMVTGEGEKAFIAGADISEMKSMNSEEARAFSELGQQVSVGLENLPYPTVACVNGFALMILSNGPPPATLSLPPGMLSSGYQK
ncbi:MAG: enoyl-CoA hydratase-related protein [Chitinophagaceae bacterium]